MKKLIILFIIVVFGFALLPINQNPTVKANNTPMVEQVKIFQSESYSMLENAYNTFMKDNVGKIALVERPRIFSDSKPYMIFVFYKIQFKKD